MWMCIDSTSVIWCLRGNAAASSQWAFLSFQEAIERHDIRVRWSPGHTKIPGNEEADRLADEEAHAPHPPYGSAAEPTISGLKSDVRGLHYLAEAKWWREKSPKLSSWYKQWNLTYGTSAPTELNLSRRVLGKILAIRTSHVDFAWYHRKFRHVDAALECPCGRLKKHVVFCRLSVKRFGLWPHRPICPP
jgi:hypothetical protein